MPASPDTQKTAAGNCSTAASDSSAVPTTLNSLWACPYDKAPLNVAGDGLFCSNPRCGRRFPLVKGIPILIRSENSLFSIEDFTQDRTTTVNTKLSFKRRLWQAFSRCVPSISHNPKASRNYERFCALLLERCAKPVVLVVGGGEVGSGMEDFLRHPNITFVECDVYISDRVHAVADGHDLPFLDGSFDGVACQAVLEHVVDPQRCVGEIHRVLKSDGVVYAEIPFMQQVHMQGYDFTRFTLGGCRRLFRHFRELDAGAIGGPGMALAWSISHFVGSLSRTAIWSTFRAAVVPFFVFWLKYLDYVVDEAKSTDAASACYFLGERSETVVPDRDILHKHWSYR